MGSRTLRFFTSNEGKVREVSALLGPLGYTVRWERQVLEEPQADDLEHVVRAKLEQVPGGRSIALVEDSGLFIPSLGGFPGVYSAYVLRTLGLPGILRLVKGKERAAYFLAVIGLKERGRVQLFRGRVDGRIPPRPRGTHGFGYDPIFLPEGESLTTAEMPSDRKNEISHRGKALRGLARYLALTR